MSGFRVTPELLDAVLAAVVFLYADHLPDEAWERLSEPTDRTRDALSRLVDIRLNTDVAGGPK